jgi:hypothetical protein
MSESLQAGASGVEFFEQKIRISMGGAVAAEMCIASSELERVAYHEAGHAAVVHHYGAPVARIAISALVGGCTYHGPHPEQIEPLAETLRDIQSDDERIAANTRLLILGGHYPDLPALRRETAELLRLRWSDVCRVARVLMDRAKESGAAELSGAEVEALWRS